MKIVIINGSARKGNTLAAINAFIKGASEKNEIEIIEPDKLNIAPVSYTHLEWKRYKKISPLTACWQAPHRSDVLPYKIPLPERKPVSDERLC